MTELTHTAGDLGSESSVGSWPRTVRRTALRPAASRRALYATAREEARLVRGRNAFVWRGRVLPMGVPLAAGAGAFVWHRRRSTRDMLAVALAVGALSYLEARVEWTVRRNVYRRRREAD
jgi:hypothetical protein